MQRHTGTLECLALVIPCRAEVQCDIDFDDRTVLVHVPAGWHTVLRDGLIRFCCAACWKALQHA